MTTEPDYEEYAKRKYVKKEKGRSRTHRIVINYISKSPLIDLGCGDGSLLKLAEKKGIKVIGIEISKFAVNLCKKEGLHVYHKRIEDLERLKKWKNKFGTVTMIDTLEHLKDQNKALQIAHTLLREDGELIVVLPNPHSLKAILKLTENPRDDPFHTYCPTLNEAKSMIKKAGFEIKKIIGLGRFHLPVFLSQAFMIISKKSNLDIQVENRQLVIHDI
jgi:SAM-dependent methyltransferase